MNETLETIHSLRSIHGDFSSKEVIRKDLETVLNACVRAANASNRQSYSIIVVEDRAVIKEFLGYEGRKALIFCVDFNRIIDTAEHLRHSFSVTIRDFITGTIDTILAAQTAAIAAKSLGIDSLFTNSIHRGDITRIYRQFELPEKCCFPLISLILGYPSKEPEHLRGRLSGKGIIHYNKYDNLTDEELAEIVQEYDDPRRHLATTKKWKEQRFLHYLDWFYSVWSKRNDKVLQHKVREFYTILNKTGFLQGMHVCIKTRRSIRRYKQDPVSDEIIHQLIDAACCAPSADNIQPWEFIVVRDKEVKEKLSKAHTGSYFVKDAPVCIVALGNERLSQSYFAIDTTCAIQNLVLASHSLGLGACWVGVYDPHNPTDPVERHVRTVLNVPSHLRIIAMIPIGYSNEKPGPRTLREMSKILHFDSYGSARYV